MQDLKSHDKLLTLITHDLLNPVGAVLAYSDLLLMGPLTDKQRRQVEAIQRASLRGRAMLQNLADLTSLQAGRLELNLGNHPAAALAAELRESHACLAERRGVALKLSFEASLPDLRCDRERLLQLLSIVLTNAIQHGPENAEVMLTARAEEKAGVRFEISDSGPGIPDELLDGSALRPSRGLSLALARALATAQGGELALRPAAGQGTTVSCLVPRAVCRTFEQPLSHPVETASAPVPPAR